MVHDTLFAIAPMLLQVLCTTVLALPAAGALMVLVQVCAALVPRRPTPVANATYPRVAVLVPAHDESRGLLPTLGQVRAQLRPGDRLLVVADNCSDDTAAVARCAGAEVSERVDTARRGKGHALDHGVRQLGLDPPDVLVVLDADCRIGPDCIPRIVGLAWASGRPVQARYLMTAGQGGLKARIAEFAWRVKNWVRPRGMHRLGLPCGLYGAGMAFPWALAATAPFASGHLAEDIQLGVRLATRGAAPLFCEAAEVSSSFAASREGASSQRTRWEHGHLSLLFGEGPRLLARACVRGQWRTAGMILDMLVPPLALLALSIVAAAGVSVVPWALLGWHAPLRVAGAGLAMLTLAVLLARAKFAADLLGARELFLVPLYALAKLPLYARFLVNREVQWIRTRRGP